MKKLEQGHIYKEEYDLLPEEDKKKYYNACFSKINWSKRIEEEDRLRKVI